PTADDGRGCPCVLIILFLLLLGFGDASTWQAETSALQRFPVNRASKRLPSDKLCIVLADRARPRACRGRDGSPGAGLIRPSRLGNLWFETTSNSTRSSGYPCSAGGCALRCWPWGSSCSPGSPRAVQRSDRRQRSRIRRPPA